jgi:hypothetical protein
MMSLRNLAHSICRFVLHKKQFQDSVLHNARRLKNQRLKPTRMAGTSRLTTDTRPAGSSALRARQPLQAGDVSRPWETLLQALLPNWVTAGFSRCHLRVSRRALFWLILILFRTSRAATRMPDDLRQISAGLDLYNLAPSWIQKRAQNLALPLS